MNYDAIVHLRLTQEQLKYIESKSKANGVNKSTVVRTILDKAMDKDEKRRTS